MQRAIENANHYQPNFINMAARARPQDGIPIMVGKGEFRNVAIVPMGSGDGRAVRTQQPLPRTIPGTMAAPTEARRSPRRSATSGASSSELQNVFGFKVTFVRPNVPEGHSLGGRYLVGVTTPAFTGFSSRNGLQQSSLFWGIEDAGHKHEGPNNSGGMLGRRRGDEGIELSSRAAPRNDHNVLFGCKDIVTVVVDFSSRTLSFWRNDMFMGTLVQNLPRTGNLYPVVVPFNAQATVSITAMNGDPLPCITRFMVNRTREQQEQKKLLRAELERQRQLLVGDGRATPALLGALNGILRLYTKLDTSEIDHVSAARLWYRCGMKMSHLDELIDKNIQEGRASCDVSDFLNVINEIIREDCEETARTVNEPTNSSCGVGDVVELTKEYEQYGDALKGPMVPGDRGRVVEVQNGHNGERHSIRVLYNGRRWWYQPQALVSERSGLVSTPAVWFLRKLLRAHGYDADTLRSFDGQAVTKTSWRMGDIVEPIDGDPNNLDCFGRLVAQSPNGQTRMTSLDWEKGHVLVESASKEFGALIGHKDSDSEPNEVVHRIYKVKVAKLRHASALVVRSSQRATDTEEMDSAELGRLKPRLRPQLAVHIDGVSRLQISSINAVIGECERNANSVLAMLENGLTDTILDGIAHEPKSEDGINRAKALSAIGRLCATIARVTYGTEAAKEGTEDESASAIRQDEGSPEQQIRDLQPGVENGSDALTMQNESSDRNILDGLDIDEMSSRGDLLMALLGARTRPGERSLVAQAVMGPGGGADGDGNHPLDARGGGSPLSSFVSSSHRSLLSRREALSRMSEALRARSQRATSDGDTRRVPSRRIVHGDTTMEESELTMRYPYLNALRRGGFSPETPSREYRGTLVHSWVKTAIQNGLQANNADWVELSLEVGRKRRISTVSSEIGSLLNPHDEDKTSLCMLSVMLGCSHEIVRKVVEVGGTVGDAEVQRAAYSGQPSVLAELLKNADLRQGTVVDDRCNERVRQVLSASRRARGERQESLKSIGNVFFPELITQVVKCALACRLREGKDSACFLALSKVLVGSVHMEIMNKSQKSGPQPISSVDKPDGGRESMFNDESSELRGMWNNESSPSDALLRLLPQATLAAMLKLDCTDGATGLLLLVRYIEACLWSKDVEEISFGLTILLLALQAQPLLAQHDSIRQYAFLEVINFHQLLAASSIDAINRKRALNINSRYRPDGSGEFTSRCLALVNAATVCCPKLHVAELHVTKHSSFRCDLCGKGVDCGRVMYGCRECDWDACEQCIDREEMAVVKWRHVQDIASRCTSLLQMDKAGREPLATFGAHGSDLETVCSGIRECDARVLDDLGRYLSEPFLLSMYEFATMILPALHDALHYTPKTTTRSHHPRGLKRPRVSSDLDTVLTMPSTLNSRGSKDEFFSGLAVSVTEATKDSECTFGLVHRIQEVISFLEYRQPHDVPPNKNQGQRESSRDNGILHKLLAPVELELVDLRYIKQKQKPSVVVQAEPLMGLEDLKLHLLRTMRSQDSSYEAFCRGLVNSVILDSQSEVSSTDDSKWKLAKVTAYDDSTGAHVLNYAVESGDVSSDGSVDLANVVYASEPKMMVMAARQYIILHRGQNAAKQSFDAELDFFMEDALPAEAETCFGSPLLQVGMRVESSVVMGNGSWGPCTIIARRDVQDGASRQSQYDIASDSGEVFQNVNSSSVRPPEAHSSGGGSSEQSLRRLQRDFDRNRMRAFIQGVSRPPPAVASSGTNVLRRTWSALSFLEEMKPIDLKTRAERNARLNRSTFVCLIGESEKMLCFDRSYHEPPMKLQIDFTVDGELFSSSLAEKEETVYRTLKFLNSSASTGQTHKLYFSVEPDLGPTARRAGLKSIRSPSDEPKTGARRSYREALFGSVGVTNLDQDFDPISVNCMELIALFGQYVGSVGTGKDDVSLESRSLTTKLMSHLEDPLDVVAGGIPAWCVAAPCKAPVLFSYKARRLILEKVAFGISRSVLREQETRVNVATLRQRMTTLRGRAVELVGEAFSGGAEDPTALQLQAEELYGMEEALAARVRASFRSQKWQERALQVAKAAIRRDRLLADAAAVVDSYAQDNFVRRRRLEVRFEGESGFDAASGDQAGVTRGFYSDVAEKLLSCEHVSSVYLEPPCVPQSDKPAAINLSGDDHPFAIHEQKLPLWIPDVDSSRTVVIPTPRADPSSSLGVYPRPLSPNHPQITEVKQQFRFMGRLFAGAIRDSFMFPLPLSCAFLKLVQQADKLKDCPVSSVAFAASDMYIEDAARALTTHPDQDHDMEDASFEENSPTGVPRNDRDSRFSFDEDPNSPSTIGMLSKDLPRPGFLGGEIYAVESFVCSALDRLDKMAPPLSGEQLTLHQQKIGADTSFARVALGKNYDCSFDDYFKDRTFVDPLDPTQGECAMPLCENGHVRPVSVQNVREWVMLAKEFVLLTGVREQAIAFRKGVEDFFPPKYLSLFTPQELQRDVCGGGDNVDEWTESDIKALFNMKEGSGIDEASAAVVGMGGGVGASSLARRFDVSSWTMKSLFRTLKNASPLDRRSFLSFVTSVPIARKGMSKIEVVPIVSSSGEFLPLQDPGCLPRANTCARRLYLPKFETFESFEQVLWAVVRQECKFKGFYEWRG